MTWAPAVAPQSNLSGCSQSWMADQLILALQGSLWFEECTLRNATQGANQRIPERGDASQNNGSTTHRLVLASDYHL